MNTPATRSRRSSRVRMRQASGRDLTLLEDISTIITQSGDVRSALERIVEVTAQRMDTEVCSLYIYDRRSGALTLWATTGLERRSVGRVTMKEEEGLVGYTFQLVEPVMAIDAMAHPRYKYFPETGEERYHSFLAVPVLERREPSAVLVVQTSRRRRFSRAEVRLLRTIAGQVSGIISQARLLESLESKEEERREFQRQMGDALRELERYQAGDPRPREAPGTRTRLTGQGASPGFAVGKAHRLEAAVRFEDAPRPRRGSAREEVARFRAAVRSAIEQTGRVRERVSETLPEIDVAIFDTHRLMLEDQTMLSKVEKLIRDGTGAEAALGDVVEEYVRQFEAIEDEYLRERSHDVRDIGQRILRALVGVRESPRKVAPGVILVASELVLTDLLLIEPGKLKGMVLATGGVTSHASILARSLEIPTVIGVEQLQESVHHGDPLVVDGNAGTVYVNPPADIVREYERLDREYRAFNRELGALVHLPAETVDNRRVVLLANIGLFSDVHLARQHGAEGIGLYRTELPFLTHRDFLTEDEQVDLYSRVVEAMGGLPVTIRTLDLGADKYPAYLRVPREENPFLGWRSIRISLEMADVFKAQLRAILRVSAWGNVRILFPMISSVEEIRRVKELLDEARYELQQKGVAFAENLPTGIMIEVPSAVSMSPRLIHEVDFFSIGTNDLIQYTLAVDRNNRKVASLYEPLHPAVLRAINYAARAALDLGKPVSICGEMAADPMCTLVLVGIGLETLSMGSFFVPVIKRLVRAVDFRGAQRLAQETLNLGTVKEVKGLLFEGMRELGVIDVIETYH